MFDADLAKLYGASTKALNQAFRRNKQRFPADFAFQLSSAEYDNLKSQIVTSSAGGANLRSQIVTSSSHEAAAARPTLLPNKASQCSPASSGAPARWK
jgi:hypothetical protein